MTTAFWIALFVAAAVLGTLVTRSSLAKISRAKIPVPEPPPDAPPAPGEPWYVIVTNPDDGSPWYQPNPRKLTVWVLDVKDGWVRYHHGTRKEPRETTFPYAYPIETFTSIFKRDLEAK